MYRVYRDVSNLAKASWTVPYYTWTCIPTNHMSTLKTICFNKSKTNQHYKPFVKVISLLISLTKKWSIIKSFWKVVGKLFSKSFPAGVWDKAPIIVHCQLSIVNWLNSWFICLTKYDERYPITMISRTRFNRLRSSPWYPTLTLWSISFLISPWV